MENNWPERTLGDVIITNNATYSKKDKWKFINYLDTGNLTENQISEVQYLVVGEDKIPSRAKRKIEPGDIVYSTVRPNQKHYGILKNPVENLLVSTGFVTIRAKQEADTNFIYWFLVQSAIIERLQTIGEHSTSAYPSIKPSDIEGLKLNLPPLTEQKAIAHILGSLDDKIELNRRMNETLEAMAQALFQSWFIDFDPVIDNALAAGNAIPEELKERAETRAALGDARKPLPEETQNLFPSEFERASHAGRGGGEGANGLGWIPKGWRTGIVCDLGEVICGNTPPTNDPENYGTEIPFITIPDMHSTVYITHTGKTLSRKGADTQKKKYLPANSICVSCIATPGLVVINSEESQTNQQINSVIPNDMETAFFAYEVLSRLGEQIRNAGSGGSVFSNLSKGRFEELKILLGSNLVQTQFNSQVRPYFEKILSNQKSVDVLSHARDTLLPQLLSGEIRIPEAEKLVEGIGIMRDEL